MEASVVHLLQSAEHLIATHCNAFVPNDVTAMHPFIRSELLVLCCVWFPSDQSTLPSSLGLAAIYPFRKSCRRCFESHVAHTAASQIVLTCIRVMP